MSAVGIRNLDDRVKERLRPRAARHGRSMEAEMRAILTLCVPRISSTALTSRLALLAIRP
jgi:plasmid stability protein